VTSSLLNRRQLLAAALSLVAVVPSMAAIPPGETRRLSLVRGDNGERFSGPYRGADGYDAVALGELAHFMRDRHVSRMVPIDPLLLDLLSEVLLGVRATEATLLSGYRSPETNAKLAKTQFGVAERSHHVEGRAIDFWVAKRLREAVDVARRLNRGGIGWYPGSNFIHLDTGPPRFWTLHGSGLRGLLGARAKKHKNLAMEQCLKDPARRARCGQALAGAKR